MKKIKFYLLLLMLLAAINPVKAQKDGGEPQFPIQLPSIDNFDFTIGGKTGWSGFDISSDYNGNQKILIGINPARNFSDVLSIVTYEGQILDTKLSLNSDGGAMFKGNVDMRDNSSVSFYRNNSGSINSTLNFIFDKELPLGEFNPYFRLSLVGEDELRFTRVTSVSNEVTFMKFIDGSGSGTTDVEIMGGLNVGNNIVSGSINTGNGTFSGDVSTNGELSVSRGITLQGDIQVLGQSNFGESISLNSNVSGYTLKLKTLGNDDWGIEHNSLINEGGSFYGMGLRIKDDGSNGFYIRDKTSGLMRMVIRNGNVGIGTDNPTQTLDVNGSINATDIKINGNSLLDRMWTPITGGLSYNGIIGIGTSDPAYTLDVAGTINATDIKLNGNSITEGQWTPITGGLSYTGIIGIGTSTPVQTLDVNGRVSISNGVIQQGGAAITNTSDLGLYSRGNNWIRIVTNNQPITFFTDGETNSGKGTNPLVRMDNTGGVGYGTLTVDGKLRSEEVLVETVAWPDYVFDEDYNLLGLSEVENHIESEGRLPGMPSEEEVIENGINVGEMTNKLLEKIEELTLYVIEQCKKIEELESEVSNMKSQK